MSNRNQNSGCLFGWLLDIFKSGDKAPAKEAPSVPIVSEAPAKEDYSKSYQQKWLLTKNEWYAHKKLRELAEKKNLIICPKVRLLDIIEPRNGQKNYMALMGKIQSKHIDFVVCNSNMKILGVVELDDGSHNKQDRKERDQFVDQILTGVGYKVVHIHFVDEHTLDSFIE